jgi:hypothetical protein
MLILLALPVIVAVTALHRYLQLYAPSNMLVRRARSAQPRWRTVAALAVLTATLLAAMHGVTEAVAAGAPTWLYLLVLVLAWDTIKCALAVCATALRTLLSTFTRSSETGLRGSPLR